MLLSIDTEKAKALLAAEGAPAFTITSANLEVQPEPLYANEPVHVFSTVMVLPPELERARERLQALRSTVKASDDLDNEIDEIRGR